MDPRGGRRPVRGRYPLGFTPFSRVGGFATILQSMHHLDGSMMLRAHWTCAVRWSASAWQGMAAVPDLPSPHGRGLVSGSFPFTWFVHVLSGLLVVRYLVRPWQVVRRTPGPRGTT
ncbi:MAG: respiratory nitrate reductase subunit gamma [Fibrobacteres bacterium]|nr:respiratory nitrate reductase subunit gamma [Fibrobacterota bacterium]